jgi:putative radical SAM enzyme (TIGR03279 family)
MTYFTEIELTDQAGGRISSVEPGSAGRDLGVRTGDELLAINEHLVQDVIDVQFYSAESALKLTVRRDGELLTYHGERAYGQNLGIEFTHPTFDTDIRRCNNLCEFCFVLQMAPRFRRTLYIKDDDYRYSFLFGHYVTLTNLSDHDWWRIEHMRLSPLYISVHATDLSLRRQFLRNPQAPDILEQLSRLAKMGIEVHAQLVIVPKLNDGRWLVQSIRELRKLWPAVKSVSVVPVGLTRHHKYKMRSHTQAEAHEMTGLIHSFQSRFQSELGLNFVYLTDEWYLVAGSEIPEQSEYDGLQLEENGLGMVRSFLDEWKDLKAEITREINSGSHKKGRLKWENITLISGTLFAPTLERSAKEFSEIAGIRLNVLPIINQRLGESITVAGLLMVEDILSNINDKSIGELLILPRVIFDHPDLISLDDRSPIELANKIQKPVALADSLGDVWDAACGKSKLLFYPEES